MSESEVQKLNARIRELEQEVADRESDLKRYRNELGEANTQLESLIGQIRQELKVTQKIQRTLIPTEFPSFPGFDMSYKFIASRVSGGDYFDLFEHKDRLRFGVIVASASGHSMSAILLSVLLKLTHQMESKNGAKPHEILKSIVGEMKDSAGESDRADIFYAFIDRRSYTLTYSALGTIGVFHRDGRSGQVKELASSSEPIEKSFSKKIETKSIKLNPNDLLAIVTRGITEAVNLNNEPFGSERVMESILSEGTPEVHQVRNKILHQCEQFSSGQDVKRDQTVLVLEVKDKVIRLA